MPRVPRLQCCRAAQVRPCQVPAEVLQKLAGKQRPPREDACYVAITERAGNVSMPRNSRPEDQAGRLPCQEAGGQSERSVAGHRFVPGCGGLQVFLNLADKRSGRLLCSRDVRKDCGAPPQPVYRATGRVSSSRPGNTGFPGKTAGEPPGAVISGGPRRSFRLRVPPRTSAACGRGPTRSARAGPGWHIWARRLPADG